MAENRARRSVPPAASPAPRSASPAAARLRSIGLLVDTAARHMAEDPLLLALQSARRLPHGARAALAGAVGVGAGDGSLRTALASLLADRPERVVESLARARPSSALGRRLAAEIAVAVGLADLLPGGAEAAPARIRARDLWSRGHLDEAIGALDAVLTDSPSSPGARPVRPHHSIRAARARLSAELATMSPGFALPPVPSPSWRGPLRSGAPRVLHLLTNSVPHTQSGYALRSHHLLLAQRRAGEELRAVTRIGYPVTVGRLGAAPRDVVDGVEYHRLLPSRLAPTPAARLAQTARLLAREVAVFRPEVLHTTTNYANALVVSAVARGHGLPWVYEMRGMLEYTWVASRPPEQQAEALASQRFALLRAKEAEMARSADAVVVLSSLQRDDLVARGVPAERITVIPNAVEGEVLAAEPRSPAEARARLGLPTGGFWVGSVSSLVDYEGFDVLLRAVAIARGRGVDARCAIVGDGVSRPGLLALAQELDLLGPGQEACVLPGRVPAGEALGWYQALDAFCAPRRDTPVCRMVTPLKPLTAQALGRPVIASDLPALVEVTRGGGLLFPAGDAGALAARIGLLARAGADDASARAAHITPSAGSSLPTWEENGGAVRTIHEEVR
ncbi:glycosyl transferase family protein [Actinomyces sp. Chiba101]|uniref:Glycosyltransferase involved in cell wall bisynthesis n=1 Tax=Actinomyces denticolens TaxID=52767 RepID=A0ABY1I8A0_9ACTO|nr:MULTISPECIES: glycosyltransferase [Actinomyces]BAW93531.1 glycosyl transferase family protein [Actinomyces sp. Chiba101]SHI75488.1 Glycosyltransferase involved in cell wall bisynthesis [Actinomyces denticolens]SUU02809.1 colanic acid biosynthesis glycosyltransferase WcaL [Actinomyces denticolens]